MHVVLPLGPASGLVEHGELRFALRALEKHLGITSLTVVGVLPKWLNPDTHIRQTDPYKENKDANIISKILRGSLHLDDDFLFLSDDQVLLKPFDPTPYHGGQFEKWTGTGDKPKWWLRMENTRRIFTGKPFYNYDLHTPVVMHAKAFREIFFNRDYGHSPGYCVNSMYFNSILIPRIISPVNYALTPESNDFDGAYCLNLKDHCLKPEFVEKLQRIYDTPCRYEN
jgi:hypothetical protein